jgi:hypothetical protein
MGLDCRYVQLFADNFTHQVVKFGMAGNNRLLHVLCVYVYIVVCAVAQQYATILFEM